MKIREYYDKNTERFLRFGIGRNESAIHRPVWAEGMLTRADAIHYVDSLLCNELVAHGIRGVVDLGCGVGGSLLYLSTRHHAEYHGVTISPIQARLAAEIFSADSWSHSSADSQSGGFPLPNISTGDMSNPALISSIFRKLPSPILVFCLESFTHLDNGESFINNLGAALPRDSCFAICDDFLERPAVTRRETRIIAELVRGWHLFSLQTRVQFLSDAENSGFELLLESDLTSKLRLWSLRDKMIFLIVGGLRHFRLSSPWWLSFLGGNALQSGLSSGLVSYRYILLRRR